MKMTAHRHNYPAHENAAHESASSTRRARNRRRRQHLRHIQPMTREQQVALVEEARAARQCENRTKRSNAASTRRFHSLPAVSALPRLIEPLCQVQIVGVEIGKHRQALDIGNRDGVPFQRDQTF